MQALSIKVGMGRFWLAPHKAQPSGERLHASPLLPAGAAEGSKRKLLQDEFEFDSVISFVQELIGEVTQETSLGYTKEICFTGAAPSSSLIRMAQ